MNLRFFLLSVEKLTETISIGLASRNNQNLKNVVGALLISEIITNTRTNPKCFSFLNSLKTLMISKNNKSKIYLMSFGIIFD